MVESLFVKSHIGGWRVGPLTINRVVEKVQFYDYEINRGESNRVQATFFMDQNQQSLQFSRLQTSRRPLVTSPSGRGAHQESPCGLGPLGNRAAAIQAAASRRLSFVEGPCNFSKEILVSLRGKIHRNDSEEDF